jgi:purine-binding chemotaxis protein CheW
MGGRGMSGHMCKEQATEGFVTVITAGQLFGLKLGRVRDVFVPQGLSVVPLSPPEVAGLLNLRGRIVTALDLRWRLGLPPREDGKKSVAIGLEDRGELYALIVDKVGDVMWLPASQYEAAPANLDSRWAQVCSGVYRLEGRLLVVLDVDKILDFGRFGAAA